MVINRAKFDVCTSNSFRGVEKDTQTDRIALYILDMTASPEEPLPVTSGLRVSVQPTKPALPIRFLYEVLPNVYVFSAHKMLTTFCAPFPNRISHFKIWVMP